MASNGLFGLKWSFWPQMASLAFATSNMVVDYFKNDFQAFFKGGLFVSVISANVDTQRQILSYDFLSIDVYIWLAFFGMALAGILSFFFVTRSLQLIDPTIVAFVRALEIVFAYVAQVTILQQIPTTLAIIGAGCVMGSVLAVALQQKILQLVPSKIRYIC